jgi:hypothetical protein
MRSIDGARLRLRDGKAIFVNFRGGRGLTSRGAQLIVRDRAARW